MSAWPEFGRKAERILAEVILDGTVTSELAEMLADVADRMRPENPLAPERPDRADPDDLSPEQRAAMAARFAAGDACPHCGGIHLRACPRVKRMAFRGSEIAEVEFWTPGTWPDDDVLWPESFPPEPEG